MHRAYAGGTRRTSRRVLPGPGPAVAPRTEERATERDPRPVAGRRRQHPHRAQLVVGARPRGRRQRRRMDRVALLVDARSTDRRAADHARRARPTEDEITPLARARGRTGYGAMCLFIGDHGEAVFHLATAANELRELGDKEGLGFCQAALGIVSSVLEGPDIALERLREAESLLREVGDDYGLVIAMNSLSWMMSILEIQDGRRVALRRDVTLTERIGSDVDRGMAAGNYGRWLADKDPGPGPTVGEAGDRAPRRQRHAKRSLLHDRLARRARRPRWRARTGGPSLRFRRFAERSGRRAPDPRPRG